MILFRISGAKQDGESRYATSKLVGLDVANTKQGHELIRQFREEGGSDPDEFVKWINSAEGSTDYFAYPFDGVERSHILEHNNEVEEDIVIDCPCGDTDTEQVALIGRSFKSGYQMGCEQIAMLYETIGKEATEIRRPDLFDVDMDEDERRAYSEGLSFVENLIQESLGLNHQEIIDEYGVKTDAEHVDALVREKDDAN